MKLRKFSFFVPLSCSKKRLDFCISINVPYCSRKAALFLSKNKKVYVDGVLRKPSYNVKRGQIILGFFKKNKNSNLIPEDIHLNIIYENDNILILNKCSGTVVHPAPGHESGTIVNALLYRYPYMKNFFNKDIRPGIVHRLDKDTTGLLIVAKNFESRINLLSQFKNRTINKKYLGIVFGTPDNDDGVIDSRIGRHPKDRKKMSTFSYKSRYAKTVWKVLERFGRFASLIEFDIKTGRTHQIRVHAQSFGYAIIGDKIYKNKNKIFFKNKNLIKKIGMISRQMLHAYKIDFFDIVDGYNKRRKFKIEMPQDMKDFINELRKEY